MCGLTGLFAERASPNLLFYTHLMNRMIKHRGPDDEGYVVFSDQLATPPQCFGAEDTPLAAYQFLEDYAPRQSVHNGSRGHWTGVLGHRRLSVEDLSPAGHQPMCTPDRRFWIAYNGEIYNHIELRQQLEAEGISFRSKTDTEVVVRAYEKWGQDCLHRFNGMFAFVLYDTSRRKVFAVRDRFGVKPLYFWQSPEGWLAFASEIKQFTCLPGWQAKVNGQRAYDFLQWALIDHTDETLFAGVKQLRGGECLEVSLSEIQASLSIRRWYELSHQPYRGTFEEATKTFHDLLEDSVRLRLRADVDVGSCLSGGLDSSSIVCLANRLLKAQDATHRQKTFSACSSIDKYDERPFIDAVVQHTSSDAYYTYPSFEDLFTHSGEIVWHQDEPYSSTSIYAQWMVFKLVKEKGVKVMLDGQGADEQLAGYLSFFGPRFFDLWNSFRWKTLIEEMRAAKEMHGIDNGFLLLVDQWLPEFIRQPIRQMLDKSSTRTDWIDVERLGATLSNPFQQEKKRDTALQQLSYAQIIATNLPMLLHWEDRDSMAHSVESRTPFLDYRLVEFLDGLPADYKLAKRQTKRVLRAGMQGVLPEKVCQRTDKMAFVTPEAVWACEQHPQRFRAALKQMIEASQGIVKPRALEIFEEMVKGTRPYSSMVWRVISFGEWMQRFSVVVT